MKSNSKEEHNLWWLFNAADAACGISSNFSSMVTSIMMGPSTRVYEDPYSEEIIENTSKRRRIEEIFYKLSSRNQKILFVVNSSSGKNKLHPYVEKILGTKAGISYLLLGAKKLEEFCTKAATVGLQGAEQIKLSQLKVRQEKEYRTALGAFISLTNKETSK